MIFNVLADNNYQFTFNLIQDMRTMWQFAFMQHAFEAGTIIAIVAGIVGYFVVLRRLSFAAHALSHAGFAGAAAAVLLGISPLIGLFAFTSGGGIAMAGLGRKAQSRDVQIGTVLSFMLGLGVLFISLYKGYATEAYSILFGEILGVSGNDVLITFIAGLLIICTILVVYRRLLFTSLDEDVAEARGVSLLITSVTFMILLALATSIAVQVVGVLLIFSLLVTPAAIAQRLTTRPLQGILVSTAVSLSAVWLGIFMSFYLPYPVSFIITTTVFVLYILIRLTQTKTANINHMRS